MVTNYAPTPEMQKALAEARRARAEFFLGLFRFSFARRSASHGGDNGPSRGALT